MNTLNENKYISEMACGSNLSYLLHDNSIFLSTEHKVLQSQVDSCFVKCMKMMNNGKIQLLYLTKGLRTFASMLSKIEADNFLTIVLNLILNIIDVKNNNGFLSCQNIDISFEHIYVDPATYKVRLVYLPLTEKLFDDSSAFENELRTNLVKVISGISTLAAPKTMQFSSDLSNGSISLEEVPNRIIKMGMPNSTSAIGKLHIVAINAPYKVEFEVAKDEFVIGKKQESVDGVVPFNKLISRLHCKINRCGSQYTITDLQSVNGTYVNKVRLQPNQPYQIKNGDVVGMANSDFLVSIS